ncbi:MAG: protoheme IX farnesyltransferase [Acidobacteria bacterium]|nr:MAG: protoheme IX farnesyltransferase [Acidobacteriota bacterium]
MKDLPANVASVPLTVERPSTRAADYLALTKPRLNGLVVATSAAGYYLGVQGSTDLLAMASAVAGTALVAGGAAVLNQVYERDTDALMRRTRMRPLPDGRIPLAEATIFGLALSAAGLGVLATRTNLAAAALALATLVIYLTVYTPMKRRTPLATLVGAVPGALPPLIGWTASHGTISIGGITLFAIVFLWQIPHFMAIAWLYRDDYGRAGFPMLPVVDPEGRRAGRQAVIYALALVPVSLVPTLAGISGRVYFGIALALGVALLWLAVRFATERTDAAARRLFFGSITYLPLLWVAMIGNTLVVTIHELPAVNASLNALSTVFLVVGFALIRARRIPQHRAAMLAALATSALFLVCYTIYHAQVGSVRFTRQGFVRPVYFTILITHVTLAATVLPLALVTAARALKGDYRRHKKIARWTFPIWLYVSVTGVLVYVLLYQPTWLF